PLGFSLLLEANWLWRSPAARSTARSIGAVKWNVIDIASRFADWKAARGEASAAQFPSALLAMPDVVVIASEVQGRIVGGAIANRAEGVVGISNVFCP